MNHLDDPFQLRPIQVANRITEVFLLLEGKHIIVGNGRLALLLAGHFLWFRCRCSLQ
jgi:hypothetical protein